MVEEIYHSESHALNLLHELLVEWIKTKTRELPVSLVGKEQQMGKSQREKGKRGEREVASILRDYGYHGRRGQQYSGATGEADVVGLPGVHIEVKRVEKLNIYDAISQSKRDARIGEEPVVFHRKDNHDWLVTMPADVFMRMYGKGY